MEKVGKGCGLDRLWMGKDVDGVERVNDGKVCLMGQVVDGPDCGWEVV